MKINELIQVGTETITEQITIPAQYDEEGNEISPERVETVERERPIMEQVTRDMTPEEVAQAEAEAANMPAPEPTAEELISILGNAVAELSEIVSDNAMGNDMMTNAIADLSAVVSDMAETVAELAANAG